VLGVFSSFGLLSIQSSQNFKKIVWEINRTITDSTIHVFRVTIKGSQNNQSVIFSSWKTNKKSMAYACIIWYQKNCAYEGLCFLSEIYALRRVSLYNSIEDTAWQCLEHSDCWGFLSIV
jgi:hypothetical protein